MRNIRESALSLSSKNKDVKFVSENTILIGVFIICIWNRNSLNFPPSRYRFFCCNTLWSFLLWGFKTAVVYGGNRRFSLIQNLLSNLRFIMHRFQEILNFHPDHELSAQYASRLLTGCNNRQMYASSLRLGVTNHKHANYSGFSITLSSLKSCRV